MNHDMYPSQVENRSIVKDQQDAQQTICYHSSVYKFREIEHLIQLAHRLPLPFFNTKLIRFGQFYYLVVSYPEQRLVRLNEWTEMVILEFGERGHLSLYRLEEYGNVILAENAIARLVDYFTA